MLFLKFKFWTDFIIFLMSYYNLKLSKIILNIKNVYYEYINIVMQSNKYIKQNEFKQIYKSWINQQI